MSKVGFVCILQHDVIVFDRGKTQRPRKLALFLITYLVHLPAPVAEPSVILCLHKARGLQCGDIQELN